MQLHLPVMPYHTTAPPPFPGLPLQHHQLNIGQGSAGHLGGAMASGCVDNFVAEHGGQLRFILEQYQRPRLMAIFPPGSAQALGTSLLSTINS